MSQGPNTKYSICYGYDSTSATKNTRKGPKESNTTTLNPLESKTTQRARFKVDSMLWSGRSPASKLSLKPHEIGS